MDSIHTQRCIHGQFYVGNFGLYTKRDSRLAFAPLQWALGPLFISLNNTHLFLGGATLPGKALNPQPNKTCHYFKTEGFCIYTTWLQSVCGNSSSESKHWHWLFLSFLKMLNIFFILSSECEKVKVNYLSLQPNAFWNGSIAILCTC